jgi:tRNA (guanosine-2'-O-)-methyltransferase
MSETELITSVFSGCVTQKRLGRMEEILTQRTRYLTVALEDIYQSQNASAVLRTCECFGVQDIHIIENYNPYNINPMVLKGSDKWLSIHRYNQTDSNTAKAVQRLKFEGYRVIATSLCEKSTLLSDFDVERGKCAIFFGNEHQGVSEYIMDQADEYLKIPMYGFTQSLNISVSAGAIISQLIEKIRNSAVSWQLSDPEKDVLRAEWLQSSVNKVK